MTLRKKWLFADKNAREILGDDPLAHFKDPVLIKGNAVREVWKCGEFFFKFDKRRNHSFRKEFRRAAALHKRGIPVVRHLACGISERGNCLITGALKNSCTLEEYLEKKSPSADLINELVDFLKLMEYRRIIHRDLHPGNILYVEQEHLLSLVDVRDAFPARWFNMLLFSRTAFRRLPVELRSSISEEKIIAMLRRMGVKEPEIFITDTLEYKAERLKKEWQRRKKQILSGYPKFTRKENGLLLVRNTGSNELNDAEKIPADADVFCGAFYLDLARIPHRRVLAWSPAENIMWVEPSGPGDADSGTVARLRSRALLFGVDSSCKDWVSDASGLVKLAVWKGM